MTPEKLRERRRQREEDERARREWEEYVSKNPSLKEEHSIELSNVLSTYMRLFPQK